MAQAGHPSIADKPLVDVRTTASDAEGRVTRLKCALGRWQNSSGITAVRRPLPGLDRSRTP